MSPENVPLVPTTSWDEMASPPSVMSVQPAPRLPSDRLKLSETENPALVWVTQVTETLVTSAPAMVPEGFVTVQVCPEGLVSTVTL